MLSGFTVRWTLGGQFPWDMVSLALRLYHQMIRFHLLKPPQIRQGNDKDECEGLLFQDTDYNPQLSGHETFPLRYGWLKKAFDAVQDSKYVDDNRTVFSGPDAIAPFRRG